MNPVEGCESGIRHVGRSYVSNLLLREFGIGMGFSECRPSTALGGHVCIVVEVCTEPKVSRIATQSDITGVANAHAFVDWTMGQLPSHPMSLDSVSSSREAAVSVGSVKGCGPKPTLVKTDDIYLGPKALFKSKIPSSHDDLQSVVGVRGIERGDGLVRLPHYSLGLS